MNSYPRIFTEFNQASYKEFANFDQVIAKVMPLKKNHRMDLHYAVKDLSALLTNERGEKNKPYWSNVRLTSAYLHYFLPWNILRLGQVLQTIHFDFPKDKEEITILDIGSGPLTFPIALWISQPQLRNKKIKILASDNNPHILDLGKALLTNLAELNKVELNWQIQLVRANVYNLWGKVPGNLDLINASNVFNELEFPRYQDEDEEASQVQKSLYQLFGKLDQNAYALFVEPGTRLGSKWTSLIRQEAIFSEEFKILLPCTHAKTCPVSDPLVRMWCHNKTFVKKIPTWLSKLSQDAGLEKNTLSLSALFIQKTQINQETKENKSNENSKIIEARIISDPFRITSEQQNTIGRYACSEQGLLLVLDSGSFAGSSCIKVKVLPEKDQKSKASLAIPVT